MKLYHGSNILVTQPDLSKSKPFKDFGKGFYLSPVLQQARQLAKQISTMLQTGNPIVSIFEWHQEQAAALGLNIKQFPDYCPEWAEFVLKNRDRNLPQPVHAYDIVIGPIADDSVTYQLRRYNGGDISMENLIQGLRFAKGLTIQYFFGTEKALQTLSYYDETR